MTHAMVRMALAADVISEEELFVFWGRCLDEENDHMLSGKHLRRSCFAGNGGSHVPNTAPLETGKYNLEEYEG